MTPAAASTAQDPLSMLRDIHPPLEPGFWPPPVSFYIILLIFGIGVCLFFYWLKLNRGPSWYRAGRKIIHEDCQRLLKTPSAENLTRINHSLKRIALSMEDRKEVANLYGQKWCQWLNVQGATNNFTHGAGQILGDIYNPQLSLPQDQAKLLNETLMQWMDHIKKKASLEMRNESRLFQLFQGVQSALKRLSTFKGSKLFKNLKTVKNSKVFKGIKNRQNKKEQHV